MSISKERFDLMQSFTQMNKVMDPMKVAKTMQEFSMAK